jgi:hypothetical protein
MPNFLWRIIRAILNPLPATNDDTYCEWCQHNVQ